MPSIVACPHCTRKLSLEPQHFGKTIRCPACQQTFVAQAPAAGSPPPAKGVPPAPPPPPARKPAEALSPDDFGAAFDDALEGGITSQPSPRSASSRPASAPAPARRPRGEETSPDDFEFSTSPSKRGASDDDRPRRRRDDDDDDDRPRRRKRGADPSSNKGIKGVIGGIVATVVGVASYFLVKALVSGALFGPAAVDDSSWTDFSLPGTRAQVRLPGPAQRKMVPTPGVGQIPAWYVELKKPNSIFMICHAKVPAHEVNLIPLEQRFEGAKQGMINSTPQAKFVTQRDIRVENRPAREYVFDVQGKGKMTIRIVIDMPDVYMMLAGGDKFEPDTKDVLKFFDSFKIGGGLPPGAKDVPNKDRGPAWPPNKDGDPKDNKPVNPPKNYPLQLQGTLTKAGAPRIEALAFAPNGQVLLAAHGFDAGNSHITVWNTQGASNQPRHVHQYPGTSPMLSMASDGNFAVIASSQGSITRLPAPWPSKEALTIIDDPSKNRSATAVAISPDGKTLASLDAQALMLWDLPDGKLRQTLKLPAGSKPGRPLVQFSPDGAVLVTLASPNTIQIRDPLNGDEEAVIDHGQPVRAMLISPDSLRLAVAGEGQEEVKLYDVASQKVTQQFRSAVGPVLSLAFSPDQQVLVLGGPKGIEAWDLGTSRSRLSFSTDQGSVESLAFAPMPGGGLATGGSDGTIRLWNTAGSLNGFGVVEQKRKDPRIRFEFPLQQNPQRIALAQDGKMLASWEQFGGVRRWPLSAGKAEPGRSMATQSGQIAVLNDGKVLNVGPGNNLELHEEGKGSRAIPNVQGIHLAASPDNSLIAVSSQTGLKLYRYPDFSAGPELPEASLGVGGVVFSPDGKLLACVGKGDTIHVWDVAQKKTRWVGEGHFQGPMDFGQGPALLTIGFSKDSKTLYSLGKDRTLRFWSAADGESRGAFKLPAQPVAMAVASTEPVLAVRLQEGGIILVDAELGVSRGQLAVQNSHWVTPGTLAFSLDGKALIVAEHSARVQGWRMAHILKKAGEALPAVSPQAQEVDLAGALAKDGRARIPMTRKSGQPSLLGFSPDGKTLATTDGEDRRLQLWELATGKLTIEVPWHGGVNALAWSADGKTLATGSPGGVVRIRDAGTGRVTRSIDLLLGQFESVRQLAWGPDAQTLLVGTSNGHRLYDLSAPDRVETLENDRRPQGFALLSKDGKKSFYGDLLGGPGGWQKQLLDETAPALNLFGDRNRVSLKSGVLVGAAGPLVRIVDLRTGQNRGVIRQTAFVNALAISPDGKQIATGAQLGEVKLWDTDTQAPRGTIPAQERSQLFALAYSPDGKLLAGLHSEGVTLWRLDEKSPAFQPLKPPPPARMTIRDLPEQIGSLAFTPDGKKLFALIRGPGTVAPRGELRLYDVASGKHEPIVKDQRAPIMGSVFALSQDGSHLAVGLPTEVSIWEVGSDRPARKIRTQDTIRPPEAMAFSADGKILAYAGGRPPRQYLVIHDVAADQQKKRLDSTGTTVALRVSPDGKTVTALQATREQSTPYLQLRVWDVETGKDTSYPRQNLSAMRITLAPDGKTVTQDSVGGITLRDMQKGEIVAELKAVSKGGNVAGVAHAPDGKHLYAGTFDGGVTGWEVASRKEILAVAGLHAGPIRVVGVSPDGKTLVTAGDDKTIKFWDLATLGK